MDNVQDYDFKVSEFELPSYYYIHFWTTGWNDKIVALEKTWFHFHLMKTGFHFLLLTIY